MKKKFYRRACSSSGVLATAAVIAVGGALGSVTTASALPAESGYSVLGSGSQIRASLISSDRDTLSDHHEKGDEEGSGGEGSCGEEGSCGKSGDDHGHPEGGED